MLKTIKIIKRDFDSRTKLLSWFYFLVKDMPGNIGLCGRMWFIRKNAKSCGQNLKVWPGVTIRNLHKMKIGNGVRLGEGTMIQAAGSVHIGDNTIIGPGAIIWSTNHRFSDMSQLISEQGYEYKEVIIGSDVWLGANSIIMPGAVLNDKIVVSAGSVVSAKTYPAGLVLAGNPARKVGQRE